jgi:hypothetical protein
MWECKIMGIAIGQEEGNLRVLRIMGLLRKSELDAVLAAETNQWRLTTHVKVLVVVEDFRGWERSADWAVISRTDHG